MFYHPNSDEFKEKLPGITMKTLTHGENTLLCEFHLEHGALLPEHQHPQEQTGYLVSGKMRFFGDAGECVIEAGGSWNFAANQKHGAEILEDSVAIEVFSPVREDYLP